MKRFGLIGYPLSHSFSKKYFTEKFQREGIADAAYELYEMADISKLPELVKSEPELHGLNVTIPHKQTVMYHLDELDEAAASIGAVNVIKVGADGMLKGYNSDYFGFRQSLLNFIPHTGFKALILGTGGASKAVRVALDDLGIPHLFVSRNRQEGILYNNIDAFLLSEYRLIINTTPLGMYPNENQCPELPYHQMTPEHYLFDLVYNPAETMFMKKGRENGANVLNGLEMLHLQAEKAWEIWSN